nr:MAG TPA: regulatory protein [Caudoviricetes sp.]
MSNQNAPVVTVSGGVVTTLSTDVADFFEKRHNDVIRTIETLISRTPSERLRNFAETVVTRANPSGGGPIQSKAYRLTRDGFTFLAMGFTGKKAQAFKWAYIDAFNRMEATLKAQALPSATLTPDEQYKIQKAVAERARKSSESFRTIYRAIKTRYQIPKYSLLPRAKFEECLKFIETLNLAVPEKVETPKKPEPKTFTVTEDFLKRLQTFVYCWRYLFRKDLERYYAFLCSVNSPYAPHFWEAVHDLHLALLERNLEKLGFGPKDLDCYKFWAKTNSNLLGCADRFE